MQRKMQKTILSLLAAVVKADKVFSICTLHLEWKLHLRLVTLAPSLGQNNRCGVECGASCLTLSTSDTWNEKGTARGVRTERLMGNTSGRSKVNVLVQGPFSTKMNLQQRSISRLKTVLF